ncbi:protein YpmT, partial [Bacillus subtilis]
MKRIYQYFSLLSFTFSLYFGWLAYHHLAAEDMDQMYLNVSYCALFLSVMVFT